MNLVEALKQGRPLRRPIPLHLGSNGNGWMGSEYLLSLLIHEGYRLSMTLSKEDILANDWEVQSSAGDRLQARIRQIEMETGKTPNVLDVSEEDFREIESDCWRTGIKDKDRGLYQQLVVYMGSRNETRIVKARK